MTIKNREELVNELAEMLMQFDKDCNSYQTDVYMYIDDDGNASLDTFVNVGGNSWLDDDHYTIYTDKEHYEDSLDWWDNVTDIAAELDMTEEQLRHDAAVDLYDDADEAENLDWAEITKYINDHTDLCEKLYHIYCDYIDENAADYEQKAEEIFDEFVTRQEEMERWEREEL